MQNLANTAWAFATANRSDTQLFAALARAAELRLDDFNVQEHAKTAWAFALARAVQLRLGDFNVQGLANTA